MPGSLGAAWHRSNQNEYLCQCFLSALGAAAPVIRQEDIGIDFYCALSSEDNRRLTFHSPFAVQCGSEAKELQYGGVHPQNKRWRRAALDWFYSQRLPLFICLMDVPNLRFRLYNTSAKWMVRNECGHFKMAGVDLRPDEKFNPDRASIPATKIAEPTEDHNGMSYGVPLGTPIVDLVAGDLNNAAKLEKARAALVVAVEVEAQNIIYNHQLGVFLTYWFNAGEPNNADSLNTAFGLAYNSGKGAHVGPVVDHLMRTATVLALNYQAQKDEDGIAHLTSVFSLFDPHSFPNEILDKLPTQIAALIRSRK
jgi:hypothetical protein